MGPRRRGEAKDGRRNMPVRAVWHPEALWLGILMLVSVGLAGSLLSPHPAHAQQRTAAPDSAGESGPVIEAIKIQGNTYFSNTRLKQQIRTRANREILGIPGATWWRWIYELGDSMGSRIGRALKSSGEPPAYLDSTSVASDVERLQLFYRQQGFREATVEPRIEPSGDKRVHVIFRVESGPATHIRQVRYDGLEELQPERKQRLLRGSVFEPEDRDPDEPLQFTLENQRYIESMLIEERQRILSLLRDAGYAVVTRDSIRALVYEPKPDSFDVTFRVRPGDRYRFGDVHFDVIADADDRSEDRTDTLDVPPAKGAGQNPIVTARIDEGSRVRSELLRRALQFQPGEYYSRSEILATKRRLDGTGVFTFTNLSPQRASTARLDSLGTPYLPIRIEARTRPRHRIRAETFVLQRISGSENEIGTSLTYENANAFGGGETFRIRTSGSVAINAGEAGSTLFPSAQVEVAPSLTLPYLVGPFNRLDDALDLYDARTLLSLSFLTARRENLGLIIRARGNALLRLEMEHTPTLASLVDVVDLSLSNPDTLSGFQRNFLDLVLGDDSEPVVTDPVQRAQILEDYTQPQVNSAIRYTLRSATANPLRRRRGRIYEASAEVGNTFPYLLDRFVLTRGTVENSLPAIAGADSSNRLIYRPYVRLTTDLRRYRPLSGTTTLALKFIGGVAHPTGDPEFVPFDQRFYSGGANSVRGWRLRELGPGAAVFNPTGSGARSPTDDVANILGGDIKLEASAELRTKLFSAFTADWLGVYFVDAGNVWFGPRNPGLNTQLPEDLEGPDGEPIDPSTLSDGKFRLDEFPGEIGIGSGIGLRLAWEYLILRLDLAYRVRDPSPLGDGVFQGGLENPILHFGIGHAF